MTKEQKIQCANIRRNLENFGFDDYEVRCKFLHRGNHRLYSDFCADNSNSYYPFLNQQSVSLIDVCVFMISFGDFLKENDGVFSLLDYLIIEVSGTEGFLGYIDIHGVFYLNSKGSIFRKSLAWEIATNVGAIQVLNLDNCFYKGLSFDKLIEVAISQESHLAFHGWLRDYYYGYTFMNRAQPTLSVKRTNALFDMVLHEKGLI